MGGMFRLPLPSALKTAPAHLWQFLESIPLRLWPNDEQNGLDAAYQACANDPDSWKVTMKCIQTPCIMLIMGRKGSGKTRLIKQLGAEPELMLLYQRRNEKSAPSKPRQGTSPGSSTSECSTPAFHD